LLILRAMGFPLLGLLMSCIPDRCPRSTLSLPAAATIDTPWLMAYAIALHSGKVRVRVRARVEVRVRVGLGVGLGTG
jgi:hypothetical protein